MLLFLLCTEKDAGPTDLVTPSSPCVYLSAPYPFPCQPRSLPRESESEVTQPCLTLHDPMDCSLPGSSVHGIFQARILEQVAISFSRRSSQPRDRTQISRIVGTLPSEPLGTLPREDLKKKKNPSNKNVHTQKSCLIALRGTGWMDEQLRIIQHVGSDVLLAKHRMHRKIHQPAGWKRPLLQRPDYKLSTLLR